MSAKPPFPFLHRVLVLVFASGIVAIGGNELVRRDLFNAEVFSGISFPDLSEFRSAATTADPGKLVPWDEQQFEEGRAQFSPRRLAATALPKMAAEKVAPASAPRSIEAVDEEMDELGSSDRKELDSLLSTVTKR